MKTEKKKKTHCFKCGVELEGGACMCKWCARESELKAEEEYGDYY